jgi:hypothetical protein
MPSSNVDFPTPFSPAMIVTSRSNDSSNSPLRSHGRKYG